MSKEIEKFSQELSAFEGDVDFKYQFPNGYGISVIRNPYSYGNKAGLFEVAALNNEYCLESIPDILPDQVEGWLTVEDVLQKARQISELPKAIDS